MDTILVIGANGQVGRKLLKHLSRSGKQVLAMIRSQNQANEIIELGAKPEIFDLESDFSPAFKNVDCVVFTAGSGSATGPDKTISVDQEGAIRAIGHALAEGVKLFVMVSAQGARSPEKESQIQHYFKAKSIADEYLVRSGLTYTIYRPGRLTNEPGVGKIQIGKHFEFKGTTRRDDLARTICCGIELLHSRNKILEIFDGEDDIEVALSQI